MRPVHFFVLLLALSSGLVATATPPLAADDDAAYGAQLFAIYCQSCHGETARGDGAVARELSLRIPDLRTIMARRGDKVFPRAEISEQIDGRDAVAGHGTREMPVWGMTFREPGLVANRSSDVAERISALVDYLASIQTTVSPDQKE